MNDSSLTDSTWQQLSTFGTYIEAFGACFLIGLGLILASQIVIVVLHCRELARQTQIERERGQPARMLAVAGGTPALPT